MPTLGDYTQRICEAVAHGLAQAFNIDARFRPRNDIEVDGRKLSGTGGYFDGDTLIYQGTVLIDVDPAAMMACLNVPAPKLAKRDLDKSEARITTLKSLLGRTPEIVEVHNAVLSGLASQLGLSFSHEARHRKRKIWRKKDSMKKSAPMTSSIQSIIRGRKAFTRQPRRLRVEPFRHS